LYPFSTSAKGHFSILANDDIKAQLYKTHDEKAQVHEIKNEVQDPIQDLGRPMTRGRLRKIQEALQYKVTHLLKTQLLKDNHIEETKLITHLMGLEN